MLIPGGIESLASRHEPLLHPHSKQRVPHFGSLATLSPCHVFQFEFTRAPPGLGCWASRADSIAAQASQISDSPAPGRVFNALQIEERWRVARGARG